MSGTIKTPAATDTNTVTLNWGDGSAPTTIALAAGQNAFSTSHAYLNNPAGVGSENYTIVGSVTNENGLVGYASASVTVSKVAPQLTAADLSLSETTANEGDTITLSGQFTDPDALSNYTVTIDWGDGSATTGLVELLGQVIPTSTPGLYTFSAPHQYLHNPPGELTGGTYDINVSVTDGVNTVSADTPIVVQNVLPVSRSRAPWIWARDDHRDGRRDRPGPARHRHGGLDARPEWSEYRDGGGHELHFPIPSPLGRARRDDDRDQ